VSLRHHDPQRQNYIEAGFAIECFCSKIVVSQTKQVNLYSKQGVCHTVALPFILKNILEQKKNYGNSNISP